MHAFWQNEKQEESYKKTISLHLRIYKTGSLKCMLKTSQFEKQNCVNRIKIKDFTDNYIHDIQNTIGIKIINKSIEKVLCIK